MRWVVIALVLINAAYFVGQQRFSAAPTADNHSAIAMDKQLRLASEVNGSTVPVTPALQKTDEADSEGGQKGQEETPVPQPPPTVLVKREPPAQPHFKACYSIGPFLMVNDVSNTAKIFEGAEGIATQQRAASERSQVGYWVYIPPLDSMQSARAVLRDLQNREIREVLIISEGVKANAISAGVYNVEAQAQERRDSIRAFGYMAEIDPLYRTQPQYWLDVELIKLQAIPTKLWQKVAKNFPNITKTQRPCE